MAYDDAPKSARKVKLPEGYKDEGEFCEEVRALFQEGVDFDRENCEQGVLDLEFLAGAQWDAEALRARTGKPCLTINDLPAKVAQVVGDMRMNRPAIKVRPAEDADKDLAEIREGLIRAIERDCDAQGVYIGTGESQVACGIGNFRVAIKNSDDTGFERDIAIQAIPDAFSVVWDPYSVERTGRDAEYCFVVEEMSRKAFERRFKDALPSELEVPTQATNLNGWETKDSVRIVEFWRMKTEPAMYARLESGATVEVVESKVTPGVYERVSRGRKVKTVPLKHPIAVDEDGAAMVKKGVRKYACMYLTTGTAILSGPHELPIPRLPILRARGWLIAIRKKRVRFGLVRFARDPARLKNYWRSVSAEMLALAGKGKWLVHEQAEGDADAFREAHANDDPVLVWSGQIKPEYEGPPSLNNAVLQEAALAAQDMKDVTGLHDASLGAKSNETSGKAILARQREGDVGSFLYHDNLQAAIAEAGRVVNALIPVAYDTARTIRVVGEDETTKVQRINDPNDPNSIDINRGRYDIVVETGPSYSTKRVEAAESMAQFFQVVPAAAQAAGDLFARAQDWPMAEEIGERLKKTLPPQLTEGEEELTPEQEQQRQMAMQQAQEQQEIQKQGIMLELAEKDAKVKLTHAQAEKLRSEASGVGMSEEPRNEFEARMKLAELRKAEAEAATAEANAVKAEAEAQRAQLGIVSDEIAARAGQLDLQNKPIEQDMARQQAEKALKEPPKTPAKKG